jgi:hypothetical protein
MGRIALFLPLVLSLIPALPSSGEGQAILNVERLQGEVSEGLRGEISGRIRLASGNTDLLQAGGDLGLGRLSERHWLRAYAGIDHIDKEGKDILDNKYLHLRYNYRFSERLRTFHFFQLQANENLLLDRRTLLGTGIRGRVTGNPEMGLDIGTGLMFEAERLNEAKLEPEEEADTETVRMSNILVGSGPLGEQNRWVTVIYYQPNVESFGDYRLSGEVGLGFELIGALDLDVTLTWRHDSRAPTGLEEDDVSLRTGITYRFR